MSRPEIVQDGHPTLPHGQRQEVRDHLQGMLR
jgi:hypothetical protein